MEENFPMICLDRHIRCHVPQLLAPAPSILFIHPPAFSLPAFFANPSDE